MSAEFYNSFRGLLAVCHVRDGPNLEKNLSFILSPVIISIDLIGLLGEDNLVRSTKVMWYAYKI